MLSVDTSPFCIQLFIKDLVYKCYSYLINLDEIDKFLSKRDEIIVC